MTDYEKIGFYLRDNKLKLVTAESCTAGMIAASVANIPGSSNWLEAGFVVYTPEAKNHFLGVKFETIEKYDITSQEVAREMALGALSNTPQANISVAITGVAGPGGGTEQIPVGTVCMAWSIKDNQKQKTYSETNFFNGDRNEIRVQSANYILEKIPFYYSQFLLK